MKHSFRLTLLVALAAMTALAVAPAAADSDSSQQYFDTDAYYMSGFADAAATAEGHRNGPPRMRGLELLGRLGPDSEAALEFPNADVWAFGDYAYMGTWGVPGLCPATGVKVIDISDPTNPSLATTIPSPAGTRANDVKVDRIRTRYFNGVLLAHSNEDCSEDGSGEWGMELYDVSDPTNPVHLSSFGKGQAGPTHNVYLYQRGRRAFVLLAVEFAEVFASQGLGEPAADFVIVEVTDPTNPRTVGTWTIGRDAGLAYGSPFFADIPGLPDGADCTPPPGTPDLCRGDDFPGVFVHDVWANKQGTVAYLSYWDAGLILLDISDPTNPTMIGRGSEAEALGSDEGNLHNAVPARRGNLVIVGDEDFTPGPWGFVRIFDTSDPANPQEVGAFATGNTITGEAGEFAPAYSVHNIVTRGNRAYISWYTDGIRVVDFSRPDRPREIASFVPDADPENILFWGVYVHRDLILGSDMFGGLYILRNK